MASLGTRRGEYWAGVRGIFPLIVGAIPFGIIFGAAAVTSGLSPGAAAAMSAFVFAGSAQFVAVSMAGGGAGAWLIILTVFVINLRHVLYAATLAPYLRGLPARWLVPLGFTLTDEAFLVTVRRYQSPDTSPFKHWYYLGAASTMYVNWQLCTYIGLWAGLVLPNPGAWGLDFAFPLTFLGMLITLLHGAPVVVCVLSAAGAALLFRGLPNQLGLLIAVLCGVAAGLLVEWYRSGSIAPLTTPQTSETPQ